MFDVVHEFKGADHVDFTGTLSECLNYLANRFASTSLKNILAHGYSIKESMLI